LSGDFSLLLNLASLKEAALNLLFPRWCLGCGREGDYICLSCLERLPRLTATCLTHLDQPLSIDGIYAPFRFEGTIRHAIHELKYRHLRALSGTLAALMYEYLAENGLPGEVLVPVPLHGRRLRQRGYNQSALLAAGLSRLCGLPLEGGCLVRRRMAPAQAESASLNERKANVAGAFGCRNRRLEGKKVLLIDDVATSGATLNACATALKEAGAAAVRGLTLPRDI